MMGRPPRADDLIIPSPWNEQLGWRLVDGRRVQDAHRVPRP
jgi:hypothetical protein